MHICIYIYMQYICIQSYSKIIYIYNVYAHSHIRSDQFTISQMFAYMHVCMLAFMCVRACI
jgi:hypothetical protein